MEEEPDTQPDTHVDQLPPEDYDDEEDEDEDTDEDNIDEEVRYQTVVHERTNQGYLSLSPNLKYVCRIMHTRVCAQMHLFVHPLFWLSTCTCI